MEKDLLQAKAEQAFDYFYSLGMIDQLRSDDKYNVEIIILYTEYLEKQLEQLQVKLIEQNK